MKKETSFTKWLLSLVMLFGVLIYITTFYVLKEPPYIALIIMGFVLLPAPIILHMEWSGIE